jgi:DNA-binding MarR family transcriptional regulator
MSRRKPSDEAQAILRYWLEAVPNDRLAHLIRDAARGVTRALARRLAERDVPFGHWVFLRILWERDGLTQRELSEQAGLTEPTTLAALRLMAKRGYIRRDRRADNRRNNYVYLTPAGRRLKQELVPLALQVNQIAVTGVPAQDVARTRQVLLAIIQNLAADESSASAQRSALKRTPRTVRVKAQS